MFQRGEFVEADAFQQFGADFGEVSAAGAAQVQQGGEGVAEDAGEQDGEDAEQLQDAASAAAGRRGDQKLPEPMVRATNNRIRQQKRASAREQARVKESWGMSSVGSKGKGKRSRRANTRPIAKIH